MQRSLRLRVLLPLIGVGLVIGLIGALIVESTYERQLDTHMQRRGESITQALDSIIRSSLLAEASEAQKNETLRRIVDDLGRQRDVTLIVVVSGDPPRVVATTEPAWRGRLMSDLPRERVREDLFDAIETRRLHPHFHWETLEYDVSWPLALSIGRRPRGEPSDGAIMLHLDARPVRAQLRRAATETIIALIGAVLAIGLVSWWLTDRLVLRRLRGLERAMDARATGDHQAMAPRLGEDEIGRLSGSLNTMLRRLDATDAELRDARDHLEEQVEQRTAALRESHERLRESDRLATVGTLAAGVAHDLNNLLLPIRSHLRVLEKRLGESEAREQIDEIKQSARLLQQLAGSMRLCSLDPSDDQIARGSTDLERWWSEVAALLQRAFTSRLEHDESRFDASIEPGLPPVRVPAHRLTQAALNLLVNAGDACAGRGRAELRLSATLAPGGGAVILTVSDNGSGMPEEVRVRAFDPFFSTKKRGASSGLGLAMVRSIVESAGGRIAVETTPGDGTTFTLELPTVEASSTQNDPLPRVALTLADERLQSFAVSAIAGRAHVAATGVDAPVADVWVVDPDAVAIDAASRFLDESTSRRLVVVGDASEGNEGWASLSHARLPVSFLEKELLDAVLGESDEENQ